MSDTEAQVTSEIQEQKEDQPAAPEPAQDPKKQESPQPEPVADSQPKAEEPEATAEDEPTGDEPEAVNTEEGDEKAAEEKKSEEDKAGEEGKADGQEGADDQAKAEEKDNVAEEEKEVEEPVIIVPDGNPHWLSTEDVLSKGLPDSEVENFKNFYFKQKHSLQSQYELLKDFALQIEFITLSKEEIEVISIKGDVTDEQQQVLDGLQDRVNAAIELYEGDGALVKINDRSAKDAILDRNDEAFIQTVRDGVINSLEVEKQSISAYHVWKDQENHPGAFKRGMQKIRASFRRSRTGSTGGRRRPKLEEEDKKEEDTPKTEEEPKPAEDDATPQEPEEQAKEVVVVAEVEVGSDEAKTEEVPSDEPSEAAKVEEPKEETKEEAPKEEPKEEEPKEEPKEEEPKEEPKEEEPKEEPKEEEPKEEPKEEEPKEEPKEEEPKEEKDAADASKEEEGEKKEDEVKPSEEDKKEDCEIQAVDEEKIKKEEKVKPKPRKKSTEDHLHKAAKSEPLDNQVLRAFGRVTGSYYQVQDGKSALEQLRKSVQIRNDLNKLKAFGGVEGVQVSLSVSRWQNQISDQTGMIFRGFVYNNELNALSQYNDTTYFPNVHHYKDTIISGKVEQFFHDNIKETLTELKNYIIDFFVAPEKVYVIRLNPFYMSVGACLFTWNEHGRVLTKGPFDFRIVSSPKMAPDAFTSYQHFWQDMLNSVLQQRKNESRVSTSKCVIL